MNKKIKNTHLILSILIVVLISTLGFIVYDSTTHKSYTEPTRIDFEALLVDRKKGDEKPSDHLLTTYSDYTDLITSYNLNGHITEVQFKNYDFVAHYSTDAPCSGTKYPVSINFPDGTILIETFQSGKGACADNTYYVIPIEKGKLNTLPIVKERSTY